MDESREGEDKFVCGRGRRGDGLGREEMRRFRGEVRLSVGVKERSGREVKLIRRLVDGT